VTSVPASASNTEPLYDAHPLSTATACRIRLFVPSPAAAVSDPCTLSRPPPPLVAPPLPPLAPPPLLVLSPRYLPDKAIDLIDEAAAKVKSDLALKPEELDRAERRIRCVLGRGEGELGEGERGDEGRVGGELEHKLWRIQWVAAAGARGGGGGGGCETDKEGGAECGREVVVGELCGCL
jgi:hypothetical protein